LEDRRNVGESSCNSGDGTDQRVQSLMFMMMMKMMMIYKRVFLEVFHLYYIQISMLDVPEVRKP